MSDSGRARFWWMDSWRLDLTFLLLMGWFAWGALVSDYPWVVLAFPGVLLASPIWNIVFRLLRLPKGTWLWSTLPFLVFTVSATVILFALSTDEPEYRAPAYVSLAWVVLLVIVSVLLLFPSLRRRAAESEDPTE